jgi:hypothetical protein
MIRKTSALVSGPLALAKETAAGTSLPNCSSRPEWVIRSRGPGEPAEAPESVAASPFRLVTEVPRFVRAVLRLVAAPPRALVNWLMLLVRVDCKKAETAPTGFCMRAERDPPLIMPDSKPAMPVGLPESSSPEPPSSVLAALSLLIKTSPLLRIGDPPIRLRTFGISIGIFRYRQNAPNV